MRATVIQGSWPAGSGAGRLRVDGKEGAEKEGQAVGRPGASSPPLHLRMIQKGLCSRYSQQGRDQAGGSSKLPCFLCKGNRLAWWLSSISRSR